MIDLWVSLSAYGGISTRQILAIFEQAGIRSVELAIGPRPDQDTLQAIVDYQERGFRYRAHHAFVWGDRHRPFNLTDSLMDWSELQARVEWIAAIGITEYSVHAGHYAWDGDREMAYGQFLQNLERLYALCRSVEIILGVETMYPTNDRIGHLYLLDSKQEINCFCQDMPDMKLVIDLAHLNIWAGNEDDKLGLLDDVSRILEVHISDNDGQRDLHSRITPNTWWMPWRERIPKQVPWVLESRMNRWNADSLQREIAQVNQWFVGS